MNQIEPNDLLLFARVADEGSFSRAGERLGLPKSTVSRRVAALESQLGERLLLRTTRKLSLTDLGHALLTHARQVADEVEAAAALAQHRQVEPSGKLRVSMPGDFATGVLGRLLTDFVLRYPAISLEVDLSPRRVDLIGENFDVAIRMGDLPNDATLAARRLADLSVGLYASPDYLKRRGTPSEPEALMEHDGLQILTRTGEPLPWVLMRGEQRWEGIPPSRARANSPELLIRMVRGGAGIAMVSDHF
ncbi:MAG: LysR family transcriptional regulator, partial [Rhizobacter sp.]